MALPTRGEITSPVPDLLYPLSPQATQHFIQKWRTTLSLHPTLPTHAFLHNFHRCLPSVNRMLHHHLPPLRRTSFNLRQPSTDRPLALEWGTRPVQERRKQLTPSEKRWLRCIRPTHIRQRVSLQIRRRLLLHLHLSSATDLCKVHLRPSPLATSVGLHTKHLHHLQPSPLHMTTCRV